jgi:hypothetical protein
MSVLIVVAISLFCGLVLAGPGLSLFSLWRAHSLVRSLQQGAKERDADNKELEQRLSLLSSRMQELERAPAPVSAPAPAMLRTGMNLNKRSQALRMARQGERSEQIASTLELPRQEVELLIKVHRIVMSNM